MTHEQLIAAGYVRLSNGNYYKPERRPDIRADDPGPTPKLERHPGDGALGKVQVQKTVGRRFLVRATSIRKRLLDEDNLAAKYHIDLLRYAGIIPGDCPATTQIQVAQKKCEPGEMEAVILQVFSI